MKIRKMEISDYDSVYSLWMSCQGMGLNNIDDAEEGIERFLKRNPDTLLCGRRKRPDCRYHLGGK